MLYEIWEFMNWAIRQLVWAFVVGMVLGLGMVLASKWVGFDVKKEVLYLDPLCPEINCVEMFQHVDPMVTDKKIEI